MYYYNSCFGVNTNKSALCFVLVFSMVSLYYLIGLEGGTFVCLPSALFPSTGFVKTEGQVDRQTHMCAVPSLYPL